MEIKSGMQSKWDEQVRINDDPYGKATVDYAKRWAELMEQRMAIGEKLNDIAKITSHEADTDGITGFMYGCAVGILASIWEHGEKLRRWHNLDTQIHDEGEKANASGGVLNPAVLNISLPD
jgi:hypothetical protein